MVFVSMLCRRRGNNLARVLLPELLAPTKRVIGLIGIVELVVNPRIFLIDMLLILILVFGLAFAERFALKAVQYFNTCSQTAR